MNDIEVGESRGTIELLQPKILWVKLSKEDIKNIENQCSLVFDKKINDMSKKLAGNIGTQYEANDEIYNFFTNICKKITTTYLGPENPGNVDDSWKLKECWVNYQKKYEFNPIHDHGGLFSFVYWVKIPYNIENEMNLEFVKKSNTPAASVFSFIYTDILGRCRQRNLSLTKNDEGTIIFFPARLNHQVYPFFTSDDYRISISGNITFNSKTVENIPNIF